MEFDPEAEQLVSQSYGYIFQNPNKIAEGAIAAIKGIMEILIANEIASSESMAKSFAIQATASSKVGQADAATLLIRLAMFAGDENRASIRALSNAKPEGRA